MPHKKTKQEQRRTFRIHTNINQKAAAYLQKIQDMNTCNLNVAIEMIIAANIENNRKLEGKVLEEIIDEVLNRYMAYRFKKNLDI